MINVAIEQLVRQHFELPAFDTLNRAARRVRATLTRALYQLACMVKKDGS